nr:unnamed protein product [Naegleria fowleri]
MITSSNTMQRREISFKPHLDPYHYLINNTSGKGFRFKLIEAFNVWFKLSEEELRVVQNIVDKLHNASLLIDDIEDNSKLRRGKPCAHLIYGTPATINCANYVYFEALKDIQKLNTSFVGENGLNTFSDAISIFMDELLLLHEGQGKDIYWRDNGICPLEDDYLQMVQNKTGGLFRLGVGLMRAISRDEKSKKYDFTTLVNLLSVLFQILDDYLNLQSDIYHTNKSYCEDLTEGKFSFPIIHCITEQAKNGDTRLINILKQKTSEKLLKDYALELMKETNSFAVTLEKLDRVYQDLKKEIEKSGGNSYLEKIIEGLMSSAKQVEKSC